MMKKVKLASSLFRIEEGKKAQIKQVDDETDHRNQQYNKISTEI
jgi:hypothetical protein